MNNYSAIYSKDLVNHLVNGRFSKEVFEQNKEALSVDNIRGLLVNYHVWDVAFYLDRFSPHNQGSEETDSDDSTEESV